MRTKESLSFDDILLSPKYSDIESRVEISIDSFLDENLKFELPIISSPMDTVTEERMALQMNAMGAVGIIHRYNSVEKQAKMVREVTKHGQRTGAAIGVTDNYINRAGALADAGVSFLCLDVAHGHHSHVRGALKELRSIFGEELHLMAGNVATFEGVSDLGRWGANSVRVGIGGGSICSTRIQTGHGKPTFSSVLAAAAAKESLMKGDCDITIIADGGIRSSGDMVKAFAAGADFVMVGSLLAGTRETPGDIIDTKKGKFKSYRGMASKDAQMDWRGRTSSLEGVATVVPYKGNVSQVLNELERGIRSGLSYSGARSIKELRENASFLVQTLAGQYESSTHILKR